MNTKTASLSKPLAAPGPLLDIAAIGKALRRVAARYLPPLIAMIIVLGIWQISCMHPGAPLPAPSKVITDSWELIVDPFFDHGGVDKGLFWHLAASL